MVLDKMKHKELQIANINFIRGYYLEDTSVCDKLIKYFKDHPEKHVPGETGNPEGTGPIVNKELKDSTDIHFKTDDTQEVWLEYQAELVKCMDQYKKDLPRCESTAKWGVVEWTNLQYYAPGGGYKSWHSERVCHNGFIGSRHLVFMTYLNDVTDQGETEFEHQQIKVKPEKGLTLVWPADWTHYHRGIVSPTQEKYIITGWFNFLE